MDQGIPGNLEISVTYMLTADNSMRIIYEGVSDKDTIVNMTNHGYYNLNGHGCGNIDNHYYILMQIRLHTVKMVMLPMIRYAMLRELRLISEI